MVRVAEYLSDEQGQKVLSYDDLLSLRYKRQLEWFQYIPSIFGGFTGKLPGVMKRMADMKFIQKWLIDFESRLLGKYEKRVASLFHHLVFTSPVEAKSFQKLTSHESCYGIPMKFEPDQTRGKGPRPYDRNKLVFVGEDGHPA